MVVTITQSFENFAFGLLADFRGHAVPPQVGNILVRQQVFFGNKIGESMRLIEIIDGMFAASTSASSTGGVVLLSVFFDKGICRAVAARWPYQRSIHGTSRPRRRQRSTAAWYRGSFVAAAHSSSWLP